jgi:RNA polymerase sporulation-specific sigma factor
MDRFKKMSNNEIFVLAKSGDQEAETYLYLKNKKFIHHLANKYFSMGFTRDDIVSFCNTGYMKAYRSFDPSKGFLWITYASRCMENEIMMENRKVKRERLTLSTSMAAKTSEKDGNELTIGDLITNDEDVEILNDEIAAINEVFGIYLKKEQNERLLYIFNEYFLKGRLQADIAAELNISQSIISRGYKKIVEKLRIIAVSINLIPSATIAKPIKKIRTEVHLSPPQKQQIYYVLVNYPELGTKAVAAIVGTDHVATSLYIHRINIAYYVSIVADDSIEDEVQKYLQEYYPERMPSEVALV